MKISPVSIIHIHTPITVPLLRYGNRYTYRSIVVTKATTYHELRRDTTRYWACPVRFGPSREELPTVFRKQTKEIPGRCFVQQLEGGNGRGHDQRKQIIMVDTFLLQETSKKSARKLQESCKKAAKKLQKSCKKVARKLQESCKNVLPDLTSYEIRFS